MSGPILGIIGTAGRGPDGDAFKDNPGYWRTMQAVTQIVCTLVKPSRVVSGGAAFSDHCAVIAYLEGWAPELSLHLPTEWLGHGFRMTGGQWDAGRTSNWYHTLFEKATGCQSLQQIQMAIERGATVKSGAGGFKARNTDIANEADVMLAFTFGDGPVLKDGGTADTMRKYLGRRARPSIVALNVAPVLSGIHQLINPLPAYHYCLNRKALFSL